MCLPFLLQPFRRSTTAADSSWSFLGSACMVNFYCCPAWQKFPAFPVLVLMVWFQVFAQHETDTSSHHRFSAGRDLTWQCIPWYLEWLFSIPPSCRRRNKLLDSLFMISVVVFLYLDLFLGFLCFVLSQCIGVCDIGRSWSGESPCLWFWHTVVALSMLGLSVLTL